MTRKPLPVVTLVRPLCPGCEGTRYETRRSVRQGKDLIRYSTCLDCQKHFIVEVSHAEKILPNPGSKQAGRQGDQDRK